MIGDFTSIPTRYLQPLPRTVKPIPNETTNSYLARLAAANRLDGQALRAFVADDARKHAEVPVDRLSILSRVDQQALRHALPDLTASLTRDQTTRYACRCCAAAHGATRPVTVLLKPEEIVCLRHRRWIGRGHPGNEGQPSLTAHPEIIRANKRYRRLVRARGPAAAQAAYRHAAWVTYRWGQQRKHQEQFLRLLAGFQRPGTWMLATDPRVEACAYPQTVELTRILASPQLRALPFGTATDRETFLAEVRRTVAPAFVWSPLTSYTRRDPLIGLLLDERRHPPDDSNQNAA